MKRTQIQFVGSLVKFLILCILMAIIEGQTYNLSGSASYGIRGGDYSFTCQISGGDKFIRTDITRFKKYNKPVCEQPFSCDPSPSSDNRSTCGCINGNNSQLYLNITNVQSTDAGTWTCGDAFNTYTSPSVTLPVYYGPENIRFTPTISSIIVIENESRTVTCSAECNPPCNIYWYKGADSSGTIISSSNGLLQLNNIQRQDTAYTCQAEYTILTTTPLTKTLQITVYYGPENIRFTPTGSSITVIENESRNVTCSADCNPPCNINWYKYDTRSGSKGLLPLTKITRRQAGNYICKATNTKIPDSLQSEQLMVIVHYGPENITFTPTGSSIPVIENESRTVTCSADCNPPCNINWYKDSTIISSTERLSLNNIKRQQAGNYTCQVTNTQIPDSPRSKQLMVRVHYGPENIRFTPTGSSITVIENESRTVTCSADCNPPCNINWYKGSVPSGNNGVLSLTKRQQAGNYICQVSNTWISDLAQSKQLMVIVHYGPENIGFTPTSSSITVIEDDSITVNCSADCNPPCNINWYKGADTRGTSGTIISSSDGLLQLKNIQRQDTAYTCQAKHRTLVRTPLTKTLQITVHYGPENIRFTPTGSSITVIENESRTVTCSADCNPPCNINWSKGSARSGSNELLSLTNRQQAGNYICQVTNTQIPDSPQSKQLMVIVHYPPTITSLTSDATNNMIDEDFTVTFTCSVGSRPSSVISWSRSQQGEQLYSGSQYTIPKASCQHTDNYSCTASNNIGQPVSRNIPLHVRCSPREKIETIRNITNRINTTIDLEVDIIAYPPPTFTWYHTPTRQKINTATTQQLSTVNYKSTVEITLNSTLFGDYIVSVDNDIGVQNFTITVINGEPPEPVPDPVGSNNIPTIVGSIIGVLVIIVLVVVIVVVIYRRKGEKEKDSSQDNVPLSKRGKTRHDEMGQTDNTPMSPKTGQDNKMIIDDNLLYEGSDHLFGPQNGTESEKSKKPAKKPDPEAIYTAVVKKKNGQDNKTASGETGTYENVDLKAKPISTKKPTFNKEGLNYADVVFTNKTPSAKDVKPVYHDAVEYAGIRYGVRGPTPPPDSDSSDDDTPPPAPASKQKTKPVKTKKK